MTALAWQGRQGSILLGPTEHRVARYLERATRHGLVTLRTTRIQADLRLGRSETYRILRTLRILGLFGVTSDQGGRTGGRRIWRTSATGPGPTLDSGRHRTAWARIHGWLQAARRRALAAVRPTRSVRPDDRPVLVRTIRGGSFPVAPPSGATGPPPTMRDALLRWAPNLAREWRIES